VFFLGFMAFCQPVSYTQPKISVTYLILTAELTHGLLIAVCSAACSSSLNKGRHTAIYMVLIFLLVQGLGLELELGTLCWILTWTRLLLG